MLNIHDGDISLRVLSMAHADITSMLYNSPQKIRKVTSHSVIDQYSIFLSISTNIFSLLGASSHLDLIDGSRKTAKLMA